MQYFYVYILLCSDGSYYTGHTDNIETRIAEHRLGFYDGYTAARLPIQCVFTQIFESRDAAFNVERKIKGWSRKKKIALINGNFEQLICSNPSTNSGRAEQVMSAPLVLRNSKNQDERSK